MTMIGGVGAGISILLSADQAMRIAKEMTPASGLICVTGSLYLVGAVQQALKEFTGVAHWA